MRDQDLRRVNRERPDGCAQENPGPGSGGRAVRSASVRCGRCCGLLYRIQLRDWGGSRGQDGCDALQCIACGDIIDPLIVINRRRSSRAAMVHRKTREGRPRVALAL